MWPLRPAQRNAALGAAGGGFNAAPAFQRRTTLLPNPSLVGLPIQMKTAGALGRMPAAAGQEARLHQWLLAQLLEAQRSQRVLAQRALVDLAGLDVRQAESAVLDAHRAATLTCIDGLWADFLKVCARCSPEAGSRDRGIAGPACVIPETGTTLSPPACGRTAFGRCGG